MNNLLILTLFLGILVTVKGVGEDDRIGVLPGVNFHYNFSQYSGYLNAGKDGKWKYFYWLMESQTGNSDNDPLLVVTSTGPGCSSLLISLGGFGPFYVERDGQTVFENIFAWNKHANILVIENPIGVGFSYKTDNPIDYTMGDDLTATQTLTALIDFFTNVHPKYSSRPWFIVGLSYGGVYVPSLTQIVLQSIHNGAFPNNNLRGIAIGNGYMNAKLLTNTLVLWAHYHGLIGVRDWDIIKEKCCVGITNIDDCPFADHFKFFHNIDMKDGLKLIPHAYNRDDPIDECGIMLTHYMNVTSTSFSNNLADPFNFYQDCYKNNYLTSTTNFFQNILIRISNLVKSTNQFNYDSTDNQLSFPCYLIASTTMYLSQLEVQKALHVDDSFIKGNGKWQECNGMIKNNYPIKYTDTTDLFNDIIKLVTDPKTNIHTFRILSFNGDVDTVCNFLGNSRHINNIANANGFDHMSRYPWVFRNRLAGYHDPYLLKYNNGQGILFMDDLTVKGAAHLVPSERQGPASQMIYNFIKNIGHYNFTEGFDETPSPICTAALGSTMFMTSSFVIAVRSSPGKTSMVIGIMESSMGLGVSFGSVIGGALYEYGGFRLPFLVLGSSLILAAVLSFFLIGEFNESTNEAEDEKGMFGILSISAIWIMICGIILCGISLSFLGPTLADHLASFNISSTRVGLMFMIYQIMYTISAPIFGMIIDRWQCSNAIMIFGAATTIISMLLIGPSPLLIFEKNLLLIGLSLAILGIGAEALYIPTYKNCLEIVKEHGYEDTFQTNGYLSGIVLSVFTFGCFIGPTLGSFSVEHVGFGWTTTVIAFTNATFILVLILSLLTKSKVHPVT